MADGRLSDLARVDELINVNGELAQFGIVSPVPVLQVKWYDERASCKLGILYSVGEIPGKPDEYTACYFYASGHRGCRANGNPARDACVFHLPESAAIWQRIHGNALLELPDGSTSVCSREHAARFAANMGATVVGAVRVEVGQ